MKDMNRRDALKAGAASLACVALAGSAEANTEVKKYANLEELLLEVKKRTFYQEFNAVYDKKRKNVSKLGLKSSGDIELDYERATILSNQKVMMPYGGAEWEKDSLDEIYRRISGLISKCINYELFGFQPLLGPVGLVFFQQDYEAVPVAALTRKVSKVMLQLDSLQDFRIHGLEATDELGDIIGMEVHLENIRGIVSNLIKTSPIEKNRGLWRISDEQVDELSNQNVPEQKPHRWVLASPDVSSNLESRKDFVPVETWDTVLGVHKLGVLVKGDESISVYKDFLLPNNKALLGLKWGNYCTGLIQAPFLTMFSPLVMNDSIQKRHILTRGKIVLHPQAHLWYKKIKCGSSLRV